MKTIGLLGGMGPLATVDLFEKIVLNTKAQEDQDHLPILIYNNTQVPDRTEAILNKGKSSYPTLLESCRKLQEMGADFLTIACNTSHYYYDQLLEEVDIPILHMQRIAAKAIEGSKFQKPVIMATKGALAVGLYQRALEERGLDYLLPNEEEEEAIQEVIYRGVKEGNFSLDQAKIKKAFDHFRDQGGDAFILGCTELPLAQKIYGWEGNFIDPSLELAREAILFAGGEVKDGPLETL